MADDNYIPPVNHSTMSRTGRALGEGARSGLSTALLGGGLAIAVALLAPIGVGLLGSYLAGSGLLGLTGTATAAAGWTVGLISVPFLWALTGGMAALGTIGGGALGLYNGSTRGTHESGKELAAHQFDAAYTARKTQLQGMMMAQLEQAQAAAYAPPMPAYEQQPQMASASVNNLPQAQSDIKVPVSEAKKPESIPAPMCKIDAATIEHQQRLTPQPAAAIG